MYSFATIQTAVRNNVGNSAADVTQAIDNAVNYLSNFYHLKKIGTANTVAGTDNVSQPTNCIEVMGIEVGDDYFDKIIIKKLEETEDFKDEKFYTLDDGKIYILPTPTAIAAVKIWYKSGFTPMAGAGNTDVPDRLVPILIVLATWFYFVQMVSRTATQREMFPNATPEEMQKIADSWNKQFEALLKITIQ